LAFFVGAPQTTDKDTSFFQKNKETKPHRGLLAIVAAFLLLFVLGGTNKQKETTR
jgi:hypothetical protein